MWGQDDSLLEIKVFKKGYVLTRKNEMNLHQADSGRFLMAFKMKTVEIMYSNVDFFCFKTLGIFQPRSLTMS